MTCLIGATPEIPMSPCAEVPTYCATPESLQLSLGAFLASIASTASLVAGADFRQGSVYQSGLALRPSATAMLTREGELRTHTDRNQSLAPAEAQRTPNSAQSCQHNNLEQPVPDSMQGTFPTDAKVREKQRRQKEKEAGREHVVKKRKKIMEDHHDDCGEDLSSLHDKTTTAICLPCDYLSLIHI